MAGLKIKYVFLMSLCALHNVRLCWRLRTPDSQDIVLMCTFPRKTFSYSDFEKQINNGKIKFVVIGSGTSNGKLPDLLNVKMREKFSFHKRIEMFDIFINNIDMYKKGHS